MFSEKSGLVFILHTIDDDGIYACREDEGQQGTCARFNICLGILLKQRVMSVNLTF